MLFLRVDGSVVRMNDKQWGGVFGDLGLSPQVILNGAVHMKRF